MIPLPLPHPFTRRLCVLAGALLTAAALSGCAGLQAPAPAGIDPGTAAVPAGSPAAPASQAAVIAPPALAVALAANAAATAAPLPPALTEPGVPIDPVAAAILLRGDLDPAAEAARADLWTRLRAGYALPDLEGERVRKWEQYYASRPDYVQRMTERGGRYLFHIVEEVQRRGLPFELALLPFIESAFNPQALSVARAAGMWQFMPATGRDFELRQNLFRDDRRDVLASTRAALDYLQRLHGLFGDWHLALAAYNWGQGNVTRAIARNQAAGLPTDYASLRMPEETRDYVPKLQAVKNIVARPAAFGLGLAPLENHPFFLTVPIERDIDVAIAAQLAGVSLDEFQALNPQLNKPVILAAGTPQVLLPYDNANRFLRQLELHRGALATWTAWVAPRTLKPSEAARLTGMSEAELRAVNRIPARMLVKAGSTLLVERGAKVQSDVAGHIADTAMMMLAPDVPPLRRVAFKAGRKGETVAAVARRWRVRPAQVAQWNDVPANGRFKAGQTVVVMVPQAAVRQVSAIARPAPRRAAAKAPAAPAGRKLSAAAARKKPSAAPAEARVRLVQR